MTAAICPAEHKHAEVSTCYIIHKCRCEPCKTEATERARRRARAKLYGRWVDPYVDAQPVREHVRLLQASGMGWKRIAEVSGVGNTAVSQLIYGRKGSNSDPRKGEPLKRVLKVKAEKILAVQPEMANLRAGALVDPTGFRRRVQALVAVGWSLSKLAKRLGVDVGNLCVSLTRERVTAQHHRDAAALYDELWNMLPPHEEWRDLIAFNRAKRMAKVKGWLPPLAWDDIDTDDAPPVPEDVSVDPIAVELALSGARVRLNRDERREAVRQGVELRWSDVEIAGRIGVADRTVWRIRGELGLASPLEPGERVAA
ncbi:MAG: hypothetical protein ACJLS2_02345 [Microcella pacifica]